MDVALELNDMDTLYVALCDKHLLSYHQTSLNKHVSLRTQTSCNRGAPVLRQRTGREFKINPVGTQDNNAMGEDVGGS